MRRVASYLLVLAAGCCVSCGPSADDAPFLRSSPDPDVYEDADADARIAGDAANRDVPDAPLEEWDTSEAGELSGIFAVEVVVRVNVVIDVETRQLFRLRILQDGQDGRTLRQQTTLCRLLLPSVEGLAEITIPPALENLIQTKADDRTGRFLSSADPVGARYTPDPAFFLIGAELESPETDPMPDQDDLTGALDEDGDGQPGVTLVASAIVCDEPAELYAALRTRAGLSGTVTDLNTIEGEVDPVLDQSVLGFSDPCIAVAADLPIEVDDGNTFLARRVGNEEDLDGNGNVSCTEIVRAAPTLFGEYWLE